MSYDNNWSGRETRDRGGTEIAILLVLLVLVLFGLVLYFFYLQVSELGDKNAVLTQRIATLENRLERSVPQEPAYVQKLAPVDTRKASDTKDSASKAAQRDPFTDVSVAKPKTVDTLIVRPDGTMIDPPKSRGKEEGSKTSDIQGGSGKTVEVKKGSPGGKSEQNGRIPKTGDTEVDVEKCFWEEQVVHCDLIVSTLSDDNRKIQILNRDTFASDYKHATYRVSSFQVGVLGDRQRFRSTAFFSRNMPLPVQFQFYGVSPDVAVFKTIQFNIDGRTFAFEDMKISGAGTTGQQPVKTAVGGKKIGGGAVRTKKTSGEVAVDLQHCTARKKKIFCDLRLTNVGPSAKEVVISKDKAFARSRQNIVRRFTSFSLMSTDEKHHHHTRTYLKKGRPQLVRFHLFDPVPGIAGYKAMQFNIDGQTIVFENVALGS